jgi:hypothetical protein
MMPPLFKGTIATSSTVYIDVPIRGGAVGAQFSWPDATSSATLTLELSSNPGAGSTSGNADDWTDSGVAIAGPVASARGSSVVNVDNVRQRRARIKIVTAAATTLTVWDGLGVD